MNKAILREFAVESRKDLMDRIKLKLNLFYIDEKFDSKTNGDMYVLSNDAHVLNLTKDEKQKRDLLLKRISEIGIESVIEEAAYTWFNRIIAIRYMEIHDFLPLGKDNESLGIRVLSSNDNTPNPEIMKYSNLINNQLDILFDNNFYININNDNEKFKYILLLVCNKLKKVIPDVFDGVTDYIDLLIPENMLTETGFVSKLIKTVPIEYFNKTEVIGWLYQYYNQIEKDRVISAKKTYKKNEIAYATQLFTPDWIVKYMVDNSLGKFYLEHGGSADIKMFMNYFIDSEIKKKNYVDPKDISFIDPCCGSGHILIYAFELLYKMYELAGYNKNDIPYYIVTNNIHGLDVDDRAGQLSILSVILKAREYDKNFFKKDINLNVLSIQESNGIDKSVHSEKILNEADIEYLINNFINAKEIGSLLNVEKYDLSSTLNKLENNIFDNILAEQLKPLIKQNNIMSKRYDVVVTNPPYMNSSLMPTILKNYVAMNFKNAKGDLFSAFIEKNISYGHDNSYYGFMTPYVWMFISSYEPLRSSILSKTFISSLIQLEYSALEEATVPLCTFVLSNEEQNGIYFRLSDFTGGMKVQEEKFLEFNQNKNQNYYFIKNQEDFKKLPNNIIGYWLSEKMFDVFGKGKKLSEFGDTRQGMATSDVNRFTRLWYEVDYNKIGWNYNDLDSTEDGKHKWFPYIKGGKYRKWSGNYDTLVNWEFNGKEVKQYAADLYKSYTRTIKNINYYLKECVSWGMITSADISVRYYEPGYIFDIAGCCLFAEHDILIYLLAFLNTKLSKALTKVINPTINMNVGDIANLPVIYDKNFLEEIKENVNACIDIMQNDWDLFETSWKFKIFPYIDSENSVEGCFSKYLENTNKKRNELKTREENLNKIFNKIYDIEDEFESTIDDKSLSLTTISEKEFVKLFISYVIGCIFGRYSSKKDGIICGNNSFNVNDYSGYIPDEDNIIPISDNKEVFYSDDLTDKVINYISYLFGEENLTDNMNYISNILGRKGTETFDETIRRYLLNDFFTDHSKLYQKRPIYWLVDSGKKNGFKCFIYSHRYNNKTLSKIRVDYLHKTQDSYERLKNELQYKIQSSIDVKENQSKLNEIIYKIEECNSFDERLGHFANQMIDINLDDGIKVNYDKLADILAKIK